MARSVEDRILKYNEGRLTPLLDLKYKAISENPFRFFRGTDHLFYEDIAKNPPLKDKTRIWACGDLHLENFGSYRANNGQVYFDINDFDEAALAPTSWEIIRFLVSIYAASEYWAISSTQAAALCAAFTDQYKKRIIAGKAYAIEKATTSPLIQTFIEQVEKRSEFDLLKKRILLKPLGIIINNEKALPAAQKEKERIKNLFSSYLKINHPEFQIQDIAIRISGTGSLGLKRYIILVQHKVKKEFTLFDLKMAQPSVLAESSPVKQPSWKSEAERIVTIQKLVPYAIPRYLDFIVDGKDSYIFRQLQPAADKFDQKLCKGKTSQMEVLIRQMASAVASAQIRSASRYGSSSVDELIEFAKNAGWQKKLLSYAVDYHKKLLKDFEIYRKSYSKGTIKASSK